MVSMVEVARPDPTNPSHPVLSYPPFSVTVKGGRGDAFCISGGRSRPHESVDPVLSYPPVSVQVKGRLW